MARDQRAEIATLLKLLRKGELAIDVGANKGAYVYWMRRAVGPTGAVMAFEPQKPLASYLSEISSRMDWSNVSIRQCAVSDSNGMATLWVPRTAVSPGATLENHEWDEEHQKNTCRTIKLDDSIPESDKVSFIKVDVEGHELSVFRGASRILEIDKPHILFECESRHLSVTSVTEVLDYLRGRGYRGFFFNNRKISPVDLFDAEVHQGSHPKDPSYCNNFLFSCEDISDRI